MFVYFVIFCYHMFGEIKLYRSVIAAIRFTVGHQYVLNVRE